jgi:hypothetical protein
MNGDPLMNLNAFLFYLYGIMDVHVSYDVWYVLSSKFVFATFSSTVLFERLSYFGLREGRLHRGTPVIADERQIVRRLPPNVRRKQLIVARIYA